MMTEWLEKLDREFVLWINSFHTPFLDEFFWVISSKWLWIPFYILLIYLFFKKEDLKRTILYTLFAIIAVAVADLISVQLFKELIMRYRPSHNSLLNDQLHFYTTDNGSLYKGGQYGFVSSHAANFAALFTWSYLHLRKRYKFFILILIVLYIAVVISRIYLGVHYLSDVVVGGLLGVSVALILYKVTNKMFTKIDA